MIDSSSLEPIVVPFELELRVRAVALAAMAGLRDRFGDRVPAREIERGFMFEGERVRFVGPGMGIFKPKLLHDGPLTVRTTLGSGYADRLLGQGGGLSYDFAPPAREYDNQGLTRLSALGHPLIYLVQVAPKSAGSEYAVFAPLWVSGVDAAARRFELTLAPPEVARVAEPLAELPNRLRVDAHWAERAVRVRLHQAHFRRIVLDAYRNQCAVCRLRVRPLLDAAHLIPDSDFGEASVDNGIGMCALHHRAFDRGILRVTPDYTVRVEAPHRRSGDLAANDMLVAFDGRALTLPRDERLRPSRLALERLWAG